MLIKIKRRKHNIKYKSFQNVFLQNRLKYLSIMFFFCSRNRWILTANVFVNCHKIFLIGDYFHFPCKISHVFLYFLSLPTYLFFSLSLLPKEMLHWRNIKDQKDFTIGQNSNPLLWLAEIIELVKGLIIWVA